jgi:hypothetical protein
MKNKIFSILAVLMMLTLIPCNTAFATTDSFANQDLVLAQESAQNYIEEMASIDSELSQWVNAKVVNPQPYYNLDGEINAYMFEVVSEKGIAGYVLIGSSLYCYNMLEAGTVISPTVPETYTVQKAIKTLGLTTEESEIFIPDNFIYTGVDGRYVVYTINKQKVAVNLIFGDAVLVSDLKMTMTAPEDYLAGKKETSESKPTATRSTGYYLLAMYASSGACGPASGVSIGAYYRDILGYNDLYDDDDMYDDLYITMDTYLYDGETYWWDYGPGFVEMTENCDYTNFSDFVNFLVTHSHYWDVRDEINAGHPIGLLIASQNHWRAIRGYSYNTDTDNYTIICTNSATGANYETLNWDALGAWIYTVLITD